MARRGRILAILFASSLTFGFASPTAIQDMRSELATGTVLVQRNGVRGEDACSHLRTLRLGSATGVETFATGPSASRSGDFSDNASKRDLLQSQTSDSGKTATLSVTASKGVFDGTRLAAILFSSRLDAPEGLRGFLPEAAPGVRNAITILHRAETHRLEGVPPILADLVSNDRADVLATAYAPSDPYHATSAPFDALLGGQDAGGRFVPPMAEGDHPWMRVPLPKMVFSAAEQKCLATGIYFEARGEKSRGQAAVAQVILNRVRNPAYPDTVCDVVYQNQHMLNRCQFSFACDGVPDVISDRRAYRLAKDVALAVTAGKIFLPEVASSTHYNATYVHPKWAQSMERMTQIGKHIFYRTFGGGWS
ncbi:cell wall hydrolase [Georhizobium profundi]|jgi:spore germination cell wall hydrolase CwlJ-like protein|uniref:Cell wall hydrolase n=3 Tax=Hyphomicrobiales TaxID=356 RepID=A0A3S9AZ75_9HYPH|nr:cell wall hydrolase [Georhizobium profundi]AZN70018.1 cell wall hydrolase [Georhizobium profundi]MCO6389985.1 cell wall hydrolase [Aliihoeflea aestuarii]TYR29842.1 cell wall hydrolase [Mesorhizobium microcysteis]